MTQQKNPKCKLTVGQKLWWVWNECRRGEHHYVTVEKVGRDYAHVSHRYRVRLTDLEVDGGQYSSPARCYLSKEDWEREQSIRNAWGILCDKIRRQYSPPKGIHECQIEEAHFLLFGTALPKGNE